MRRVYIILVLCSLVVSNLAQTQLGMVKTKGRMVNGKHVAGRGLSGVTITIQGRSAVLTQTNGGFSFPVTTRSFMVQDVHKNGYQLVDADATRRSYQYSPNTFFVLMETPDQQAEDKLAAERKIRRTLQRQLQQREDELEELKEQNRLTQEEYRRKLQQLYDDQQNNEKLISEMAKRYSELDYDQMDELNRQISDAILNGELTRADSLLRTKGDIRQRAEELKKHEQANEQVRRDLEKSEALARQRREDLVRDCYSRFELCKMKNEHDSAAYYIELRANVDTLNVKYQVDAAGYLEDLNYTRRAGGYFKRAFTMLFNKSKEEKQKYTYDVGDMIRAYMGFARTLVVMGQQEVGIKVYEMILNSLSDTEQQFQEHDPTVTVYDIPIAFMQSQLAGLYSNARRYEDCEKMYMGALKRLQSHQGDQEVVELDVADIQRGLALLYYQTKRYEECEAVSAKAVAIYKKMLETEQTEYIQNDLSNVLLTQGKLYRNQERYDECERAFLECSSIRKSLTEKNPLSYQSAYSWSLSELASEYIRQERYEEAYQRQDTVYLLRRQLCRWQPEKYKDDLIAAMGTLSYYAILTKRFKQAEDVAANALEGDSTKQWIKVNLAAALLLQGKYINAESYFIELDEKYKKTALDDFQKYAELGIIPPEYETDVETIKRILEGKDTATSFNDSGLVFYKQGDYAKALESFSQALAIREKVLGPDHPSTKQVKENLAWADKQLLIRDTERMKEYAFIATVIDGDCPARQQHMSGEYIMLEFADWNINSTTSLFNKNKEQRGKPKTIVVMKDGVISQHHFGESIGVHFGLKQIGQEEKERIMEKYYLWKKK